MDFFIGSYTRMGGPGVGKCRLEDNRLSLLESDPLPNSTYVIYNRAQDKLFAICSDPVAAAEGGSVASYDISGGQLRRISRQDTLGGGPCHLALDETERFLYTANYFTGSVSVFAVGEGGELSPCVQHVRHTGHSVHPERQTGPHAHQVSFIPGTRLLCVVDLGLDALMVYQPDEKTGELTLYSRSQVPGGLGPRHLIYAKNGLTYLACEVASQAAVLRWNGKEFQVLQVLPTLPEDFTGKNTASAIRLTSDETQLLISNRGHDSIAVYRIGGEGLLTLESILKTGDDFPRDFALVDDDTLLIGHQNGQLTLARRTETALETIGALDVKGCVCVALPRR